MESQFYTRTTGRFRHATRDSFGERSRTHDNESVSYIFSEESAEETQQYPLPDLSVSQRKFIESFLRGISMYDHLSIDPQCRAIHPIGVWLQDDGTRIVTCSVPQPRLSNATVHLSKVKMKTIKEHSNKYFSSSITSTSTGTDTRVVGTEGTQGTEVTGTPSIYLSVKNPRLMGRFAIPLADSLIHHRVVDESSVKWSNVVLSKMQPVFVVAGASGVSKCRLTHASCSIMLALAPSHVGITSPVGTAQNYSIRSKDVVTDHGTSSSITIHRMGTLQFQGRPEYTMVVGRCFKSTIDAVMASASSARFLNSLALI